MSYTKEITLWCDCGGCAQWTQECKVTLKRARKIAKRQGWTHTQNGDFCPNCSANKCNDQDSHHEKLPDQEIL